jgi:acyl phosphate:glycerol-3-phosphate acyltransferase
VGALRASAVLPAAFAAGSVPFSNLVAHWLTGTDLRDVGNGTVSGTALARLAGFGPLALAGVFEVAKGALGPALCRDNAVLTALAGAGAVAGHNWSPWLHGAGGRGISPAMGALLVSAPAGAAVLAAGLAMGRLGGETAVGSFLADILVIPLSTKAHGRRGAMAAAAVVVPMLTKRLLGNAPPKCGGRAVYLRRLVLDRDTTTKDGRA